MFITKIFIVRKFGKEYVGNINDYFNIFENIHVLILYTHEYACIFIYYINIYKNILYIFIESK